MAKFKVRSASPNEFSVVVERAGTDGWNSDLPDLLAFHAADPAGLLIGYFNDEPVCSIPATEMAGINAVTPETLDRVIACDRQFLPADREIFIRHYLLGANSGSRWGVAFLSDDKVRGLGAIRQCHDGNNIDSLFADRQEITQAILTKLRRLLPDDVAVIVDVPEANPPAVSMVQRFGFEPNFETVRMYKGATPNFPISRKFGVTKFELG